jgi:hypothetical protein
MYPYHIYNILSGVIMLFSIGTSLSKNCKPLVPVNFNCHYHEVVTIITFVTWKVLWYQPPGRKRTPAILRRLSRPSRDVHNKFAPHIIAFLSSQPRL